MYTLITAARNEEHYISQTIESVIAQTVPPAQWIIVSDNSTDATDAIVAEYARRVPFIRLLRESGRANYNFASKVHALHRAITELETLPYQFIGNLDADVSFADNYFEMLIGIMRQNPRLGVTGGYIYDHAPTGYVLHRINNETVAGAVQFFRRECFESLGNYPPLKYGGEDAALGIIARMKGWEVQSIPALPVYHHKHRGTGSGNAYRNKFREGLMDYSLRYHPVFELVRNLRFLVNSPILVGGILRTIGYLWGIVTHLPPAYSPTVVRFLRAEQSRRMVLGIKHYFSR